MRRNASTDRIKLRAPSDKLHFSHRFYTKSYSDLTGMDELASRRHFDSHGHRESRYCSAYHFLSINFPSLRNSFSLKSFLTDNPEYKRKTPLQSLEEVSRVFSTGIASDRDKLFSNLSSTTSSTHARHGKIWEWVQRHYSQPSVRVLEIGSRAVCSDSLWRSYIPNCAYTGFDILPGKNVDVVGDAHKLSEYFQPESFDLIVSFAVFEHLAMPWLVSEEISKIIKPSGHVAVETHFSFSEHELPWHFFQFNANALAVLFNQGLGYTIVDYGHDNPMVGRFSVESSEYLIGKPVTHLYCHSAIIAQKSRKVVTTKEFDWRGSLTRVVGDTMYPRI